jgi:hypothetical protein
VGNEYEQSHASLTVATVAHNDTIEPGQSSRSSLLRKLDHAVASGLVQRKARDANGVADGAEHAVAAASSSSGSPLPDTLMRKFEGSLGADLSGVRVHTGGASERAAGAVGAKAYTMGNDIHFGAGHYDPSSSGGQHLLAHEVAHTVQQSSRAQRVQFKLDVSSPGDSLEHEADRAAEAMVSGGAATVSGATRLSRYALQRQSSRLGGADAGNSGRDGIQTKDGLSFISSTPRSAGLLDPGLSQFASVRPRASNIMKIFLLECNPRALLTVRRDVPLIELRIDIPSARFVGPVLSDPSGADFKRFLGSIGPFTPDQNELMFTSLQTPLLGAVSGATFGVGVIVVLDGLQVGTSLREGDYLMAGLGLVFSVDFMTNVSLRPTIPSNFVKGRANETMAKFSLGNANPDNFGATDFSKTTLKNASGKTVYTEPGRRGARIPDPRLPATGEGKGSNAKAGVELKARFGNEIVDPAIDARHGETQYQLTKEAKIFVMTEDDVYSGQAEARYPYVQGRGVGVTTGWWYWYPPWDIQ